VLMQVVSNGCRSDLIPGFGSTAVAIDGFLSFGVEYLVPARGGARLIVWIKAGHGWLGRFYSRRPTRRSYHVRCENGS
jgi:hypothetical protein